MKLNEMVVECPKLQRPTEWFNNAKSLKTARVVASRPSVDHSAKTRLPAQGEKAHWSHASWTEWRSKSLSLSTVMLSYSLQQEWVLFNRFAACGWIVYDNMRRSARLLPRKHAVGLQQITTWWCARILTHYNFPNSAKNHSLWEVQLKIPIWNALNTAASTLWD